MADPTEPLCEQALQLIVEMLQQITTARGYYTDLGAGDISTEPTQRPANTADAYVVLTETAVTVSSEGTRTVNSSMTVVIEFVVPCGGTNRRPANLARRGRDDIVRALRTPLRDRLPGVRTISVDQTQRLIFDDQRYVNSVIGQATATVGLTATLPPATP
ncbi:hypothetical protein [Tahibacter harae]|uniref:Uncharacterized protein n=1 Tax=Tahibacter harae TaxID=2963937 RepID=A0ABT1QS60_9GAMM|nr:hypothetical protein [Tahibacter harae]MCQ4165138.1 hypothetical protein [Tahibacter harae]